MNDPGLQAAQRGASSLSKTISGHLAVLVVLTLASTVIPRLMGVERFGEYAAAIAVVAMLQAVSSLGLQQVQLRYLPPLYSASDKLSEAARLGSSLLSLRLALAILAGGLTVVWLSFSPQLGFGSRLCLLIGVFAMFRGFEEATRSFFLPLGKPGNAAGLEFLRVSMSLGVVILLYERLGLAGVFSGLAMTSAALFILGIALLQQILPMRPPAASFPELRPYLTYSLLAYLGQVASLVHAQLTVYMVANWVDRREAGAA